MRGRVEAGLHVGSIPYGYIGVSESLPEAALSRGRGATVGTHLKIVEAEAVVIRRIFGLFAGGRSRHSISKLLNKEKVPSPKYSRKTQDSAWSVDAIERVLRNDKYRGVSAFNRSWYWIDRETGATEKRLRDESEWILTPNETLRIVTDEQWDHATKMFERLDKKNEARRRWGMNRAAVTPYLYSGLLRCGLCGSRLIINGKKGVAYYTCPEHKKGGAAQTTCVCGKTVLRHR